MRQHGYIFIFYVYVIPNRTPRPLYRQKALHITVRGGVYTQEPYAGFEMADRYLPTLLEFLGICEITTIAAKNLDMVGADLGGIVDRAKREVAEKAKVF